MADTADEIALSEDGFSVPTVEVLTGRGFITGKSGSGKSNTASVIAEELLEAELPMLIIDTDGEYYGLMEEYEMLHVGGDDMCDLEVGPAHAQKIATIALDRQVPVILDVSGYRDQDVGRQLVGKVVSELFAKEKKAKTPFLLVVEEAHEFIPEQGGMDDVGETLVRVAKRGRKRGLGMCAISQRPASVSKDYITQCDWLVWHRLTWDNDTAVVDRILGSDAANDVQDLDDGQAIVMTDWDGRLQRVKFRRKHTFDAGATPDLTDVEKPDLTSIDSDLIADLQDAVENGEAVDADDDDEDDSPYDADEADDVNQDLEESVEDVTDSESDSESSSTSSGSASSSSSSSSSSSGSSSSGSSSSTSSTSSSSGRSSRSNSRRSRTRSTEPASDPAWEVAQFVQYVAELIIDGTKRAGRATADAARRAGRATTDAARRASAWLQVKLGRKEEHDRLR